MRPGSRGASGPSTKSGSVSNCRPTSGAPVPILRFTEVAVARSRGLVRSLQLFEAPASGPTTHRIAVKVPTLVPDGAATRNSTVIRSIEEPGDRADRGMIHGDRLDLRSPQVDGVHRDTSPQQSRKVSAKVGSRTSSVTTSAATIARSTGGPVPAEREPQPCRPGGLRRLDAGHPSEVRCRTSERDIHFGAVQPSPAGRCLRPRPGGPNPGWPPGRVPPQPRRAGGS